MTEIGLLLIIFAGIVAIAFAVIWYDKKLLKQIDEYEIRLEKKGLMKRHHYTRPKK